MCGTDLMAHPRTLVLDEPRARHGGDTSVGQAPNASISAGDFGKGHADLVLGKPESCQGPNRRSNLALATFSRLSYCPPIRD